MIKHQSIYRITIPLDAESLLNILLQTLCYKQYGARLLICLNNYSKMPVIKKTVEFFKCTRCKHEWYPRGKEPPKTCPKCRSPYWDMARKSKKKE